MTAANVLVVEDEKITLELVGEMLSNLGHRATLCGSAEAGMSAFDGGVFEAVLSDVELPGMDGLEMLRRMRASDPVFAPVVMTARRDQATAVRALECGVGRFLNKPFTQEQLAAKLTEALAERERAVETRLLLADLMQTRADLRVKMAAQRRSMTRIERYLSHLLDAAPFGILSTDMDDKILTYNGTAREMHGYQEEEVVGQQLAMLLEVPPESPPQVRISGRRKSGSTFPVLLRRRDIVDTEEECIARLYVVEDLSEREQLEDQLLYASRLATLGQLAPRIAHEFKVPLQLISGYTELTVSALRKGDTERSLDFMAQIQPAVGRVLDLVQQISDLGKPEQARMQTLSLAESAETVLGILGNLGVVKHCRIRRDYGEGIPPIVGDPAQIRQVFQNLIVNAADAMEGSREREIAIELRVSADGHFIEVVLSDTGPGIPAEHLDQVFQPFFTTKSPGKGTGLGLSIVKSALDRQGASIRVESRAGEGTRFYLSFPISRGVHAGASAVAG